MKVVKMKKTELVFNLFEFRTFDFRCISCRVSWNYYKSG